MLQGVYTAVRKDGTIYYRSNITYKSKHISLGSFDSELSASRAYATASTILLKETNSIEDSYFHTHALAFDKIVTLINFRDNGMYIKTPIYLRKNYFSYYLDISHELKFDIDDLFYYSEHRILKRQAGNDVLALVDALQELRNIDHPIVLHVSTAKARVLSRPKTTPSAGIT